LNTEYRQDIYHSYLILSGGAEIDRDAYPLHMIRNNEIPGFLPCRVEEMDGELLFYYDVTSKQTLKSVMENSAVDAALLRMLFLLIPAAMETLAEFLLDPDGMLLTPELIYMNHEKNRMWFCYYPGSEDKMAASLQMLGEGILPRLDHTDREAVILGYAFYQKCCAQEDDIPVDFFRSIEKESGTEDPEEIRGEAEKEQKKQEELVQSFFEEDGGKKGKAGRRGRGGRTKKKKSGFFMRFRRAAPDEEAPSKEATDEEEQYRKERYREERYREERYREEQYREEQYKEDQCKEAPGAFPYRKQSDGTGGASVSPLPADHAERTAARALAGYDEDEETQVLKVHPAGGEKVPTPAKLVFVRADRSDSTLILRPGQEFVLDRPAYIIGKSSRAAAIVIPCPTVSRVHAGLTWVSAEDSSGRAAGYVLQDLHSKNGSSVNGVRLSPDESIPLSSGDEITFADLIFRYIIDAVVSNKL